MASASVGATITPAMVTKRTSSARRPAATAASRMPAIVFRRLSSVGPPVKTTSACLPANLVPAALAVAVNSTGVRCRLGAGRCGPSTLNHRPSWWIGRIFAGSA